jgi:hypothetical protein
MAGAGKHGSGPQNHSRQGLKQLCGYYQSQSYKASGFFKFFAVKSAVTAKASSRGLVDGIFDKQGNRSICFDIVPGARPEPVFATKRTQSTKNEPKILENRFVPFVSFVVKLIPDHRGGHLFPT